MRRALLTCVLALLLFLPDPAATARTPASPPDTKPAARYRWPLGGGPPRVLGRFEVPAHKYAAGHRGVDLAAGEDAPVLAAGGGVVSFAGQVAGRGVVVVTHPDGLRTTYEPVTPEAAVGQDIEAGGLVGHLTAGHDRCGPSTCLHWGVRRGEDYLDPLTLLGLGRVRLLPVAGRPSR